MFPDVLDFLNWTWPQIEPYYQELIARPLNADSLDAWMTDWGSLGKCLDEAYWRLWAATTLDTLDETAQNRFHHFLEAVQQPAHTYEQKLKEKLLASDLQPEGFQAPLDALKADAAIFRENNLPLLTQDHQLGGEYDRIRSLQTVQWQGAETTLVELALVNLDADRAKREQAWRLGMARALDDREALNVLWQHTIELRHQIARNADLPDYRAYRWLQMHRLDYTPQDCEEFHDAIEAVVVPAAQRVIERRCDQLGLESLRPWDTEVEPPGWPPLRPFHNVGQLEARTQAIFECLDPEFAAQFATMRREGLLDLDNRKGKMPSSYCATYGVSKRPFVFMNVVGTHEDVVTLFHECGHAFHSFACTPLPHHAQLRIGTEFHEVAAITMELLAAPYLAKTQGGFYNETEAARARIHHLEGMLRWWPYIAVVDAFQHWVYTHIEAARDPAACDAHWAVLWARFMEGEDWRGLDDAMKTGWQRKLHIFRSPFYYIDYGLAQLGAVQIWRRALENAPEAIALYRQALALGGTVSLRALYQAAGTRLAFDAATFKEAVEFIEDTIDELRANV